MSFSSYFKNNDKKEEDDDQSDQFFFIQNHKPLKENQWKNQNEFANYDLGDDKNDETFGIDLNDQQNFDEDGMYKNSSQMNQDQRGWSIDQRKPSSINNDRIINSMIGFSNDFDDDDNTEPNNNYSNSYSNRPTGLLDPSDFQGLSINDSRKRAISEPKRMDSSSFGSFDNRFIEIFGNEDSFNSSNFTDNGRSISIDDKINKNITNTESGGIPGFPNINYQNPQNKHNIKDYSNVNFNQNNAEMRRDINESEEPVTDEQFEKMLLNQYQNTPPKHMSGIGQLVNTSPSLRDQAISPSYINFHNMNRESPHEYCRELPNGSKMYMLLKSDVLKRSSSENAPKRPVVFNLYLREHEDGINPDDQYILFQYFSTHRHLFPNALYMTNALIEAVVKQQIYDLYIHNPFIDDFYYNIYTQKQLNIHDKPFSKSLDLLQESIVHTIYSKRNQHKDKFKENEQKEGDKAEHRMFGKIGPQTPKEPRVCIDINPKEIVAASDKAKLSIRTNKTYKVLYIIEQIYELLIQLEDLNKCFNNKGLRPHHLMNIEYEKTCDKLSDLLYLNTKDTCSKRLIFLFSERKGIKVVIRALRSLDNKENSVLISSILYSFSDLKKQFAKHNIPLESLVEPICDAFKFFQGYKDFQAVMEPILPDLKNMTKGEDRKLLLKIIKSFVKSGMTNFGSKSNRQPNYKWNNLLDRMSTKLSVPNSKKSKDSQNLIKHLNTLIKKD